MEERSWPALRRAAPAAVILAGMIAALTACTLGTAGDRMPPSGGPGRLATASVLPPGVQPEDDVPTDVPNNTALRANVEIMGCDASGEGWSATGSAANPGTASATYTITVFFTTPQASVLATGDTEVTVPAGSIANWEVSAEFAAVAHTVCVLRGVG